jgi:hypothetical protein
MTIEPTVPCPSRRRGLDACPALAFLTIAMGPDQTGASRRSDTGSSFAGVAEAEPGRHQERSATRSPCALHRPVGPAVQGDRDLGEGHGWAGGSAPAAVAAVAAPTPRPSGSPRSGHPPPHGRRTRCSSDPRRRWPGRTRRRSGRTGWPGTLRLGRGVDPGRHLTGRHRPEPALDQGGHPHRVRAGHRRPLQIHGGEGKNEPQRAERESCKSSAGRSGPIPGRRGERGESSSGVARELPEASSSPTGSRGSG